MLVIILSFYYGPPLFQTNSFSVLSFSFSFSFFSPFCFIIYFTMTLYCFHFALYIGDLLKTISPCRKLSEIRLFSQFRYEQVWIWIVLRVSSVKFEYHSSFFMILMRNICRTLTESPPILNIEYPRDTAVQCRTLQYKSLWRLFTHLEKSRLLLLTTVTSRNTSKVLIVAQYQYSPTTGLGTEFQERCWECPEYERFGVLIALFKFFTIWLQLWTVYS